MITQTKHEHDLEIEPPCCNGRDSEGNIDCDCYGQYSVRCIATECPGLTDEEIDDALDSVWEEPDYDPSDE